MATYSCIVLQVMRECYYNGKSTALAQMGFNFAVGWWLEGSPRCPLLLFELLYYFHSSYRQSHITTQDPDSTAGYELLLHAEMLKQQQN